MSRAPSFLLLLAALASGCGRGAPERAADAGQSYLSSDHPAEFQAEGATLSRRMIARGDSLYHRVTGSANCVLCHGPTLSGGSHGTNLRNGQWHHADGSYASLVQVITHGTETAEYTPLPRMPPTGGLPLTAEEIRALAAYVYWFVNSRPAWEREPRLPEGEEHEHEQEHEHEERT